MYEGTQRKEMLKSEQNVDSERGVNKRINSWICDVNEC